MGEIKVSQKTGKNGTNINAEAIQIVLPSTSNKERELRTIMDLIFFISSAPTIEAADGVSSKETLKDPKHKINVRFKEWKQEFVDEYIKLFNIYKESFARAKQEVGLTEIDVNKISLYLERMSVKLLSESEGNPIKALDSLTTHFHQALQKTEEATNKYDLGAIRYYLFQELINCNVFPNPVGYEVE